MVMSRFSLVPLAGPRSAPVFQESIARRPRVRRLQVCSELSQFARCDRGLRMIGEGLPRDEVRSMSIESGPGELPLAGILVAEFCNVAAGPFCGMLLADMGADIIKIEPKDGDMLRLWPPHTDGFSENFASLNRGKRSIALDLKQPRDRQIAWRIMRKCDVVIENNRPGAMDRLGLGWPPDPSANPSL